jgi:hypothetical protein
MKTNWDRFISLEIADILFYPDAMLCKMSIVVNLVEIRIPKKFSVCSSENFFGILISTRLHSCTSNYRNPRIFGDFGNSRYRNKCDCCVYEYSIELSFSCYYRFSDIAINSIYSFSSRISALFLLHTKTDDAILLTTKVAR